MICFPVNRLRFIMSSPFSLAYGKTHPRYGPVYGEKVNELSRPEVKTRLIDTDSAAKCDPDILEDVAVPHERQYGYADEKKDKKTDELNTAPAARLLFSPCPVCALYHSGLVKFVAREEIDREGLCLQ